MAPTLYDWVVEYDCKKALVASNAVHAGHPRTRRVVMITDANHEVRQDVYRAAENGYSALQRKPKLCQTLLLQEARHHLNAFSLCPTLFRQRARR